MFVKNLRTPNSPSLRWFQFTRGRGKFLASPPANPQEQVIDAQGAYLFPALKDAHCHFFGHGYYRLLHGLFGVQTVSQLLGAAARLPLGTNNLRVGLGFDPNLIPDFKDLTLKMIDQATGQVPTFMQARDAHQLLANQAGRQLLKIPPDAPLLLKSPWPEKVWQLSGQVADPLEYYLAAEQNLLSYGIAEIFEPGDEISRLEKLSGYYFQNQLKILYRGCFRHHPHQTPPAAAHLNNGRFQIWGYKVFLDGSLSANTAASSVSGGSLEFSDAELIKILNWVKEKKLVPVFHAIGEMAIEQACRVLLDLKWAHYPQAPRIEHAQLWSPTTWELALKLGPTISMQPSHWHDDQKLIFLSTPKLDAFPLKQILNKQLRLILGSDTPVESPNPIRNYAAIRSWPVERQISDTQFLAAYTSNSTIAEGTFCLREHPDWLARQDSKSLLTVIQGELAHSTL